MNNTALIRSSLLKQFGEMVRTGRYRKQEMTQEELARMVGVSRQTIMSVEAGDSSTNIALAVVICIVLDISMEPLLAVTMGSPKHFATA